MESESSPKSYVRALDPRRCLWGVAWRTTLLFAALALALTGPWYAWPVAFVLIGILQYHFLVLSHEAQHYLVARSRRLNDLIGAWFFAYPFGQPYNSERRRHMAHHKYVGSPEDPDYSRYLIDGKHPWLEMISYFARLGLYGKVLEYAGATRKPAPAGASKEGDDSERSVGEIALVALVQLVILSVFWLLGYPFHCVFFWWLPILLVAAPATEFREFCEHVTTASTPHVLKSFRLPVWERFVIGPVGFAYHAEHHFFPSIPYYHLPKVAKLPLNRREEYEVHQSYFDVLRLIRRDS